MKKPDPFEVGAHNLQLINTYPTNKYTRLGSICKIKLQKVLSLKISSLKINPLYSNNSLADPQNLIGKTFQGNIALKIFFLKISCHTVVRVTKPVSYIRILHMVMGCKDN